MAFKLSGFVRLASVGMVGNGASASKALCTFHTNDDAATVETAGYFDSLAPSDLRVGDMIMAGLDLDETPVMKNYIVTAVTASTVTIAPQTTA